MRKVILLMSMLAFVFGSVSAQTVYQTASKTYIGDVETDLGFNNLGDASTCPGTVQFSIGTGAGQLPGNSIIVSVDVEYDITALSPSVMAEQRSQLWCTSPGGTAEPEVYSGGDWISGTYSYSRNGLTIATGIVTPTFGGATTFELHAGRTQDGAGCGTDFQKVDDGTFTITVTYLAPGSPNFPSNPMPADMASLVDVDTDLTWDLSSNTTSYDVYFGTDNPPMTKVVDDAATSGGMETYEPGTMAYATTYYWNVVARNATNEIAGSVWSFTTNCEPLTYPHFDNFDSYTTLPTLPDCWLEVSTANNPDAYVNVTSHYLAYSPGNVIQFRNTAGELDPNLTLVLPKVGTVSDYMLSFYALNGSSWFAGPFYSPMQIGTIEDPFDASTFNELTSFVPDANTWEYFEYFFGGYEGTDEYIAIRGDVNDSWFEMFLDDLTLDLMPTCIKPQLVMADEILADQVTLSWTDLSTPSQWNIEYGLTGFTPTGTPTVSGVTNPATITGLTDATDYDFYVQADCGGGDLSGWSQPLSLQTACLPYALPIDEDFGENPPYPEVPELPLCWSMISQTGGQYGGVWVQTYNALTGLAITMDPFGDATSQLIVATPEIDVPLNTVRVSFWYRGSDSQDSLIILGTMETPTDYTTFHGYDTINGATGEYQYFTVYLNNYVGDDTHIAWRQNSAEHPQAQIFFDDILIEAIPSCVEPYKPYTDGITQTSAMLNWTDPVESATDWEIEIGLPGFHPDSATVPTNSYTYNNTAALMQSFEMTGLTAATTYDAYIRTDCGASEYSVWVGPMTFLTGFNQFGSIPVTEDFESGMGITGNDPANPQDWVINTDLQHSGMNSVHNPYGNDGDNVLYMLGTFDFTAKADLMLSFWQIAKTDGQGDHCYVEISTDGGMTYDQLPESTYEGAGWYREEGLYTPFDGPCFDEDSYADWGTSNTTPDNTWWKKEYFNLTDYNTFDNVVIRFRLQSNPYTNRAGWWIDDIAVEALGAPTFYADPLAITETVTPMMPVMTDLAMGNSGSLPTTYTATVVYDELDIQTENFDAGIPGTWTINHYGSMDSLWRSATTYNGYTFDETPFAVVDGYQNYNQYLPTLNEELVSPMIDASMYAGLLLEFDQAFDADYTAGDTAWVYVYDGMQWVEIYKSGQDDGSLSYNSNGVHKKYNVSQYANANFQVKFVYTDDDIGRGRFFAIDNFRLRASMSALGWLTINGTEYTDGTAMPDADMLASIIDVNIDGTGVAPGVYNAEIEVTSTDPGFTTTLIPVTMNVVAGSTISGTVNYANTGMTVLDGCTVELYNDASEMIFSTSADGLGYYEFTGLLNGDYTVKTSCSKEWGGLNGLDVILTKRWIATLHTFTPIQLMAADVNETSTPDGLDVIMLKRRIAVLDYPAWTAPEYIIPDAAINVMDANVTNDIEGICSGDVNGSYTPVAD